MHQAVRLNKRTVVLITSLLALLEIDMDNGYMWDNVELVHPHTNETRDYVQACLGLTSDPHLDPIKSGNTTIQAFETIGTAIREAYNFGLSSFCSLKLPIDIADFG